MPFHDGGEDPEHGVVAELVHGDDVEVANEAGRQVVPSAARWAHGRHQHQVHQMHGRLVLPVVPVPMTKPERKQT